MGIAGVSLNDLLEKPRGPQGQKRPADAIGCAIMVAKIATGELEPDVPMSGRMRSGKAGAKARMDRTTAIFISRQPDGTFLAASIDSPRFCVGGATEDEAFTKAQRALAYYRSVEGKIVYAEPRVTSVVSPVYRERELCLA